jgi:hypothetical protein
VTWRKLACVIALLIVQRGNHSVASESRQEPVRWTISDRPIANDAGELSGTWTILKGEGDPKAIAALPREIRFDTETVKILPPEGNFGGLDLPGPDGSVIRAIYRFDGKTLIVSQTQPDRPRPKGFHPGKVISVWRAERR